MRIKHTFLGTLFISFCVISPAYAQDLQTAIDRAGKAYSVEKLENAKTIRLESDRRLPFESHDYSSDFHDLAQQRYHTVLDVKNQQGSNEFLTEIARTSYHGRYVMKDGKSMFIAYGPDTYQDNGNAEFFSAFGSMFRGSDVLLALWMTRSESEARYLGVIMWLGYRHDLVEVDFPNSPPLKIFVRRQDGAITKMERKLPDERVVYYTFHNHEKSGGILIAREHSFYIEDERIYFSFNRDIDINDRRDRRAFELDRNIAPEAERTDQSEMTVQSVGSEDIPGQRVHQVGQGENCTTFMVVENSVIGFGMSVGLKERLDAYRQSTGITLPLKYVIASDHHDEDIGGAEDATLSGAKLLVSAQTAKKLRNGSNDHNLEVVTEDKNFGDLTIMPLATDHASSVLVAYHNTQKMLMQTGHYYSSFVNGPSYARQTAVSLYDAIPDAIRAEAVAIVSGQDLKPETWSDFVSAVEKNEGIRCHRNRPICKP